ncbi:MAG: NAD(P)(+) transhydrogenase (Re/Si-specific) subunit beta [Myxococcota bacterium]
MNNLSWISHLFFLLASGGFVLCLKLLSSPKTARKGNVLGALAMLLAVGAALLQSPPAQEIIKGLAITIVAGCLVGIVAGRKIHMTAMPQLVAIFNGLGGAASVLVSASEMTRWATLDSWQASPALALSCWASAWIGSITFSGSFVAFGKLQGLLSSRPVLIPKGRLATLLLTALLLLTGVVSMKTPESLALLALTVLAAEILGVLLTLPIGGADMPVVISLLNSYSGLAALTCGFVINSPILILAGSLVGASGVILTRLMCQAMNRSLFNVVFGAFGAKTAQSTAVSHKTMKPFSPQDVAMLLHNSQRVMVVPGYGLAVSQGQRALRELADLLKKHNIQVQYAIHPVAGRMPGHMNVLLAEVDVPYEDLCDLETSNPQFLNTDTTLIVGANDVVNPSARDTPSSPLHGMPILHADKSSNVIVFKRGEGLGFAGVDNPLFVADNTHVVFGDAKASLTAVTTQLKELV